MFSNLGETMGTEGEVYGTAVQEAGLKGYGDGFPSCLEVGAEEEGW